MKVYFYVWKEKVKGKVICPTHVKGLTIQEQVYLVIKLTNEGLGLIVAATKQKLSYKKKKKKDP